MRFGILSFQLFAFYLISISTNRGESDERVIELTSESISLVNNGAWLLEFYAIWCSYCRQLEPKYHEAARILGTVDPNIHVARIDAPSYPHIAAQYGIRGYPTIIFLNDGVRYECYGEKTTESIVNFVQRANGPAVKTIESPSEIHNGPFYNENYAFFYYAGPETGTLWNAYSLVAEEMRLQIYFFKQASFRNDDQNSITSESILVFKDNAHFSFQLPAGSDSNDIEKYLRDWIVRERHVSFPKVTAPELRQLAYDLFNMKTLTTGNPIWKGILVFVLNESSADIFSNSFKFIGLQLLTNSTNPIVQHFKFAWCTDLDRINRLVMFKLIPPNLFILGSSENFSLHPEYASPLGLRHLSQSGVLEFLNDFLDNRIKTFGGTSYYSRFKRLAYDLCTGMMDFIQTSPFIALLTLGFPISCLSFLFYCICCISFDEEPRLRSRNRDPALNHALHDKFFQPNSDNVELVHKPRLSIAFSRNCRTFTSMGPVPSEDEIIAKRKYYLSLKKNN